MLLHKLYMIFIAVPPLLLSMYAEEYLVNLINELLRYTKIFWYFDNSNSHSVYNIYRYWYTGTYCIRGSVMYCMYIFAGTQ